MRLPLSPLVQLTTGQIHPSFPQTLLNYYLLTDAELESLASFYHQRTPCAYSQKYPCPVPWDSSSGIETKRRRLGRFIGLRGCESPIMDMEGEVGEMVGWRMGEGEEEIVERAARERQREAEEEEVRRKMRWYY
ncbi:hypothetical protein QBC47DRAFT_376652 [Echria macrotheca]|uniref:Uncharacterized protein n=1 Tax=Echria macrotheca TaxID=438768 RepID=A0AAJ0F777_9PEZI|nr:hypothetical protein QBC47DRAFT_376652 [Echria macrotheca]